MTRRATSGLLVLLLLTACRQEAAPPPVPPPPRADELQAELTSPRPTPFVLPGGYRAPAVTAALPDYPLRHDYAALARAARLPDLTVAQKRRLAAQGFVARPDVAPQLDTVYRDNLSDGRPSYLTADCALYAFARLAEDTRRRLAAESFPALLNALTLTLLERSLEQQRHLVGAELKEAARRNVAYLGVAASLLGLRVEIEAGAAKLTARELDLVSQHEGPAASAILPYQVDYSALAPPEALPERLLRYHQAMAWFETAPLALAYYDQQGQLQPAWRVARQLLLLAQAAATEPAAPLRQWEMLADTRRFLEGEPASATIAEVLAQAAEIYGARRSLSDLDDFARLQLFARRLEQAGPAPLALPVRRPGWPAAAAVHLFPPPRRIDAELLSELTAPIRREAASGIEFLACLQLPRAVELVHQVYRVPAGRPRYTVALQSLQARFGEREPEAWRADLAWGLLWAASPLNQPRGRGYPPFQRAAAWADRALLTTLATWATSRHRPLPRLPGAPDIRPAPPASEPAPITYVEPVPEVYARLRHLSELGLAGLRGHGLLTETTRAAYEVFGEQMALLQSVATKELRNRTPAAADQASLAAFAHELRWLLNGLDSSAGPADWVLPQIAAIAPAANGQWVYAGLGPIQRLEVIIPHAGEFHLASGAMLSYLELLAPAAPPLSDQRWRELLRGPNPPGLPEWAASFIVPAEADQPPAPTAPPVFVVPAPPRATGAPASPR